MKNWAMSLLTICISEDGRQYLKEEYTDELEKFYGAEFSLVRKLIV